jgi:hypothetical protein
VAALAILVSMEELETSAGGFTPAKAGAATFGAVSWLEFLLACAVTLVTADCLSRERRDGTLGLLLLTDLKGLHVVLGKLCVAGITAAYILVGFLPAVGILKLTGGVSGWEIARVCLAILNTGFVALAAGMWVSGRAQTRSGAVRGSLLLIVALCGGPRFLMYVALRVTGTGEFISSLSPYTAFLLADEKHFAGAEWMYWTSLGVSQLLGWGLLVGTALRLRYNWKTIEWKPPPKPIVWQPADEVEARALEAQRVELKQKDPLCWAFSRLRIQNAMIWTGSLVLLFGGTGFSWDLLVVGRMTGPSAIGIWSGLHLLFTLGAAGLLAWASGRFLFEAQRTGELELLLSTPLGAADIVGANWRALCQPLRGAWLLVGFLILLGFLLGSGTRASAAGAPAIWGLIEKGLPVAWRVFDIIALCWIGMWFGLQARKPLTIMAWPAGLVVGIPWVISYILLIWLSFASSGSWNARQPGAIVAFWLLAWPILNLVKDGVFIAWAVKKLRAELRTTVSLGAGRLTD